MSLHKEEDSEWYDSIEDAKDVYTPIKCWSVLQFYTPKKKATTLIKSNIEVIRYLHYLVYSPAEQRYYKKFFRAYDLDTLYWYRKTITFSGEEVAVENLRRYTDDGNVTLLFTKQQIDDTMAILERLWGGHFSEPGKLLYKDYVTLLELSLDYEDYKDTGKNLTGFRTVCKSFDDKIADVWQKAWNNKK